MEGDLLDFVDKIHEVLGKSVQLLHPAVVVKSQ